MANLLFPHEQHSSKSKKDIIDKYNLGGTEISVDGSSSRKSTKELKKSLNTSKDSKQLVKDLLEYKARTGDTDVNPKIIKNYKSIEDAEGKASTQNLMLVGGSIAAQTGIGIGLNAKMDYDLADDKAKRLAEGLNAQTKTKTKLNLIDEPLKSNFNPANNTVSSGKNKAIMAHEYGHADAYKNKYTKVFGKAAPYMRIPAMAAPFAAIGGVSYSLNQQSKGKGNKVTDFIAENPVATAGAASVPLIADEAYASYKGLKMLKNIDPNYKLSKGLKTLGPALGTYATIPAIAMGSAYIAKKRSEKTKDSKEQIRKLVKKDGR